jgi:hypothetical protein
MITREELARRLGVSASEIRRREAVGQIKSSEQSGKKPLFKESLVSVLSPFIGKGKMQKMAEAGVDYRKMYRYSSEDSQKVFDMLKTNTPLEDIVIKLCLHPGIVRAITEEYKEITGAVLVSGKVMSEINELPLDGNFPLTSGEEILEIMRACAQAVCQSCGKRPGTVCMRCVSAVADAQEE